MNPPSVRFGKLFRFGLAPAWEGCQFAGWWFLDGQRLMRRGWFDRSMAGFDRAAALY